jgi:hypothetical protein
VIGLIAPDEPWQPWHRQQLADILDVTSLLAREPLDFHRLVNAVTGQPGGVKPTIAA